MGDILALGAVLVSLVCRLLFHGTLTSVCFVDVSVMRDVALDPSGHVSATNVKV